MTNEHKPGEFLTSSMLQRYYGADIAKALGIHDVTRLSHQARESLQEAGQELGQQEAAMAVQSFEMRGLEEAAKVASDAIQMMETAIDMGGDLPYPVHEIQGLSKALQTFQGELTNNITRLTELDGRVSAVDKQTAKEQQKQDEADEKGGVNEETRRRIAEHLRKLKEERASIRDERASRLEAAVANQEVLRSQISQIRETINQFLNKDKTLAERIHTLF